LPPSASLGAVLLGGALFASGLSTVSRLLALAAGAALLFVALAFISRWLVAPLARAIGRPFERAAGTPGVLACENATRNPSRTAVTAGALTVGVALVVFVAVLGAGLSATLNTSIKQQLHADYVINSSNALLPPAVGDALRAGPGIEATAARQGEISAFAKTEQMNGVDRSNIARFYNFKWASGSSSRALAQLAGPGAIVSQRFAADHHLAVGSTFGVETQSGVKLSLVVRGIQQPPVVGSLVGAVTIDTALFDRSFSQPADSGVLVDTGGASPAALRSLKKLLTGFSTVTIQTVPAFIKTAQTSLASLLSLFNLMLALSIIVSVFGIVNTLVLSIAERAREIGTLRAMGMTRKQLRQMIRIEGEITALIGGMIGIVVGSVWPHWPPQPYRPGASPSSFRCRPLA
jgi:putative ABC transport system permease protein